MEARYFYLSGVCLDQDNLIRYWSVSYKSNKYPNRKLFIDTYRKKYNYLEVEILSIIEMNKEDWTEFNSVAVDPSSN